jgi:hypothetical protein
MPPKVIQADPEWPSHPGGSGHFPGKEANVTTNNIKKGMCLVSPPALIPRSVLARIVPHRNPPANKDHPRLCAKRARPSVGWIWPFFPIADN